MSAEMKRSPWVKVLLVGLPLWLAASGAVGVWLHIRAERQQEVGRELAYARQVDAAEVGAEMEKVVRQIGERGVSSEESRAGLDRMAALIDGSLGPSNTGYDVRRSPGPEVDGRTWPLIEVEVPGRDPELAAVWVVAGYDAAAGSRGIEHNASGVVAAVAVARELVAADLERGVSFLFVPHAFEADAPVFETAVAAGQRMLAAGGVRQVLCVEAMGGSGMLAVASRDTEAPVRELVGGLGKIVGAEQLCLTDDFDPASAMFEAGLPAARVATAGVGERDPAAMPEAEVLAASAGRLVELVRRLAGE